MNSRCKDLIEKQEDFAIAFDKLRDSAKGAFINLTEAAIKSGADKNRATLSGADKNRATLSGAGIPYASCCWSAHGECGRELLGVVIDNTPVYFCGCFCGREEELRKYIADGEEEYKVSRTIAADFVSQRIKEMMNTGTVHHGK